MNKCCQYFSKKKYIKDKDEQGKISIVNFYYCPKCGTRLVGKNRTIEKRVEERYRVVPITVSREHWLCPVKSCDGEMEPLGYEEISPFLHECSICGYRDAADEKFPVLRYTPDSSGYSCTFTPEG